MQSVVRVRPEGDGFVAEGPGFYVWDLDRREVEAVARELQSPASCPGRPDPKEETLSD